MNKLIKALLVPLITSNAFASTLTDKQIDNIQNSSGGSVLSVPSVGTTLATDSNTLTLTNKSISGGSNTFSNIPVSAIATGTGLSVQSGGTGDASLTAHNVLIGEGTSSVAFAAPTQYQALIGNASGDPSFQALALNQSSAVSGQLGVANGGTGANTLTQYGVLLGNGTSAVSAVGPSSNSGYVLTSNGASAAPSFQALPAMSPSVNGSAASPQSVSASGISLSAPTYVNVVFIAGSTSGNTVVTATPSITACTAAGQELTIISESAANTITLQNNADLSGSQVLLNGPWTSGENSSTPYTLTLKCDGAATPHWVEIARNN